MGIFHVEEYPYVTHLWCAQINRSVYSVLCHLIVLCIYSITGNICPNEQICIQ